MDTREDDLFGSFKWDNELDNWQGYIDLASHREVGLGLPTDYFDADDVRQHIRATMQIIERDELSFRQKAAQDLFAQGGYILYWPEDKPFDPDEFVHEMHLGGISFDPDFPNSALTLGYEYGDGVEHGITIYLTWDGKYQSAREI